MSAVPSMRLPRSGRARARLLFALALVAALAGCTATPLPTPSVVHPSPSPSTSASGTTGPTAEPAAFADLPAMLLWEERDDTTVLRSTEPGDPTRWREFAVPAGWDYAAASDSAEVVAVRDLEVAFGQVEAAGIELDSDQRFFTPPDAVSAACVGTGTPAAFLGDDDNHFLVVSRDGGVATIDAVGTLGDCAWLDSERLLTVGQGAGDPMTLHDLSLKSSLPAGIGGSNPSVSGGLLVALDRVVEPAEIVVWRTALIVGADDPAGATRALPAEVARLRPGEPGSRYLSGAASPDGDWLAIVGDQEEADGTTESRLWLIDLRTAERQPSEVPVDFPLTDVSWAG